MRPKSPQVLFGIAVSLLAAREVQAQSEPTAVQRAKYQMAHELRLAVGTLPMDAFQKGWSASLSYTLHLDPAWSWEILQVTGSLLTETSVMQELIDVFAVPREDFAGPRLMLTTGLEFSPVYGKQVLFNQNTVHEGLLVGLYGGVLFGDRPTLSDTFADPRPIAGAGLGLRFFLSELFSARVDARNFASFRRAVRNNESFELEYVLHLTLSLSVNFWRDEG